MSNMTFVHSLPCLWRLSWLLWALVLQLILSGDVRATSLSSRPYKPHILFIVMDDLGSHDLGMHGTGILTPCVDQLARDGLFLSNYYVLPSCSPTRATIMTGRYPLHTGIHSWIPYASTVGIPLDEETLPQVLRKVGYKAHAVGKWHCGHSSYNQTPTFRGFESFFGFYLGAGDYFAHEVVEYPEKGYDMRFDRQEHCGSGCSKLVDERGNYSTNVFAREAIRVIRDYAAEQRLSNIPPSVDDDGSIVADKENSIGNGRSDEQPLFLYMAFQAVHWPDQVPEQYRRKYENRHKWSDLRKTYAGMLTAADEGIYNVTQALKHYGLYNDTLIVFTTDNGGPTETCAVQGSSNYPKRGGKCSLWQGGTTGDGFVSGEALEKLGVPQGSHLHSLFHAVDWLPTLASIVGATPSGNKPLDGVDQFDSLRDPIGTASREEVFVGYGFGDGTNNWTGPALRWKQYKLLKAGATPHPPDEPHAGHSDDDEQENGDTRKHSYELYDLHVDPKEENDIAGRYPGLVNLLRKKMHDYVATVSPVARTNPDCPVHLTNTTDFGPSWIPWCTGSQRIIVYE